ncbi:MULTISPECIES: anthranilate synthase component II [Halobacillus]|uniref:Anthranilate synthase component II n=1 Tax=Halobacillus halophilus (strain ATCC 35676 / DSM 2266 / JCM 20832 / KCTC 3685 / LMG 17431 / NBRC 102448 / NCIMB 2269) TaxID=866895 RepID=I0JJI5_HALH3|nr:aminodeoxychorismate/anthranilate synthase component II [Halobacillus halophilus]ASF38459.1 aminodeoxychorismate/anthranilate synthase component II [Halobacillus halophilus]CCG44303.1 anthranilate synthase component II [Halobacillus halophilus DSM 2266]
MIYMIDHYDSFTYNLVQYLGELGEEVLVRRNDEIDIAEIEAVEPDLIFLSPGPCSPDETGQTLEVIDYFKGRTPIFGVCLGHQSIAQVFGGQVVRADKLMHGKASTIFHGGRGIYEGLNNPMEVMRYHSLIVDGEDLPECLEITATTIEGEIMGLRHLEYPIEGVQFHPESIGTNDGKQLLKNLLENRIKALI